MTDNNFSIPVLMYHHVNPQGNFINVKPGAFESHIRYLKEKGYTTLHTNEFNLILKGKLPCPKKPVMLTFDDGWLDNWIFAYPVLLRYQIKAVIFTVTSWIAESGRRKRSDEEITAGLPTHTECQKMVDSNQSADVMISWDEIIEMQNSGLIEFQPHTHRHQRWDKLYNDDKMRINNELHGELETSKKIVEGRLNKKCNVLCWPWGKYNEDYINIARSMGYELLFTTDKGTNTPATDLLKIKRIVIGDISTFTLRKKLFIHSREWLSRVYLRYIK